MGTYTDRVEKTGCLFSFSYEFVWYW